MGRNVETFAPREADRVRMYVCGPTVYSFAHIGNARPAVVFDVLTRVLRAQFSQVTYARNITDVDDKIIASAAAEGVTCGEISERFTEAYHTDLSALGVAPPDVEPRATGHIAAMIVMIEELIARTARDWSRADALRDELAALGIEVEDAGGESRWRVLS